MGIEMESGWLNSNSNSRWNGETKVSIANSASSTPSKMLSG